MLMKWLREFLEIVYVFMYSYIEAAEAENTMSDTHASVVVVNETVHLRHSFTQNVQDSYIIFLRLNIHRH